MNNILIETNFKGMKLFSKGKVRDTYDFGEKLLMVATDRLSAFDVVFPNGIPYKGIVLTQLSLFWFNHTKNIIKNHLVTAEVTRFPEKAKAYANILNGRTMFVKKTDPILVECVVRGYLTGSAWTEYQEKREVCGIKLPIGLTESEKLPESIFTPAIKAAVGHDENIREKKVVELLGEEIKERVKELSLKLYEKASKKAEEKGIIIADTKFEFGFLGNEIILIDELITPDSSRFWPLDSYSPGGPQKSFDKQFVRDYLIGINWNKQPPAPVLPEKIVNETSAKYIEAYEKLTGKKFEFG
jgi:phosphoribosylaminoimidazole-succinocarboxamide synthase